MTVPAFYSTPQYLLIRELASLEDWQPVDLSAIGSCYSKRMNIHELISAISQIGETQVGRGPKHPMHPNAELAEIVEAYFQRYPFLKQDQGYVDFMESYAGLFVYRPEYGLAIDVFGFAEVSSDLVLFGDDFFFQGENDILEDGFLAFCDATFMPEGVAPADISIFDLLGGGFAFKIDGKGVLGIYLAIVSPGTGSDAVEYEYYCSAFLKWLEILLESQGWLPNTPG